jgi:hypothetical protein
MMRLIAGFCLAATIGCGSVQPIGPFAGQFNKQPGAKGKNALQKEGPPPPITVPAVRPTPPLNLIDPDEVLPENPQAAAQKLMNELEADRKSITAPPMTAEVSRYKGGVKQY